MARAAVDYMNAPDAAGLDGTACGEALVALGEISARLAAAQTEFLRRFDAADAHDADGYGSSSAWLAAKTRISRKDARAAVRDMRMFGQRPLLRDAVAAGQISRSWAAAIQKWTKDLPAAMWPETDRILLDAAAAGADEDDLVTIVGLLLPPLFEGQPDGEEDRFEDRSVRLGNTFGGAGVVRGDLTPECTAAITAVFDALGKKRGKEDRRTQEQRYHDALHEACQLLIRAKMVPDRAGADTRVEVIVSLGQLREMPGGTALEEAWLTAVAGQPGYLAGKDAEVAACDSMTVPVVVGHADMTVIDKIITLAQAAPGEAADAPGAAGAPVRDRPAGHRLRLWPVRPRLRAAHRAPGASLQHPQPAAGHRSLRLDPGAHPPRRHPARQALRLAWRLRPAGRRLRRAPPAPQEGRRPHQRHRLRVVL